MALPNDKISTSLVGNTIGSGSRDVGTLCTHPNINKWSKWKPVRRNNVTGITYTDLQAVNYGLVVPTSSTTPEEAITKEYAYNRPRGGIFNEMYRLGDFRNYNHEAISPTYGIGDVVVYPTLQTNIKIGLPFNVAGSDLIIGIEELGVIKDCYLGIKMTQLGNTYYKTAETTISENGGVIEWDNTEPPFDGNNPLGYDYIFFATPTRYSEPTDNIPSVFYPLPFTSQSEATGLIKIYRNSTAVRYVAQQIGNYHNQLSPISNYEYQLGGSNTYYKLTSSSGSFFIEFQLINNNSSDTVLNAFNFYGNYYPTFANNTNNPTGRERMTVYQRVGSTYTLISSNFTIPANSTINIVFGLSNWLGRYGGESYPIILNTQRQTFGEIFYNNDRIAQTPIINLES